jgi:hypothetical protein
MRVDVADRQPEVVGLLRRDRSRVGDGILEDDDVAEALAGRAAAWLEPTISTNAAMSRSPRRNKTLIT